MDINKKTVLVTGASRGIGKETALQFAKQGAKVAINYNTSETDAKKTVDDIKALGGEAKAFQADMTVSEDIVRLIESVKQEFGPIDILVNNAGAIYQPSSWLDQSREEFDKSINLNFTSAAHAIQLVAPDMIERKLGRIINISSTYGFNGAAAVLSYTCAKAAILTLTTAMARELGPYNITVNCVAPGNIDTEMTSAAGQDIIDWAVSTTPLGRLGSTAEIAETIIFLCKSDFITGDTITVDGGQILNM